MPYRVERLEDRVLMAASIRLHGGVLDIRGDNGDNNIFVEPSYEDGDLLYAGVDVNGDGDFTDSSDIVKVFNLDDVESIRVNSAGGDDTILIEPETELYGDVTVVAGSGDDVIFVGEMAVRNLTINAGAGNDFVTVDDMYIDRNVTISTCAGDDIVSLTDFEVNRNLTISTSGGDDAVLASDIFVGGKVNANLGGGNDLALLECIGVNDPSKVSINGGGGRHDLLVFDDPEDFENFDTSGAKFKNFEEFGVLDDLSDVDEARLDLVFSRYFGSFCDVFELYEGIEDVISDSV